MSVTLFFSAGEPSGDQHAAALLAALKKREPTVQAVGFGGPRLEAAGCHLLADLTQHAVMGFSRPLALLHRFYGFYRQAVSVFDRQRPDAVILVDYPGFNWHLAKAARTRGIPVCFYGPPQIWAWARWRVKKLRRWVDHSFCWLPFEVPWLQSHGCSASYVGHPFFDESADYRHDEELIRRFARDPAPTLTLLPGSRDQEVQANGDMMLNVAAKIRARIANLRVLVAAFRPHHASWMEHRATIQDVPVEILCGRTPELIRAATCCLAVSGSVSLELLYHEKPSVIVYRISPVIARVEKLFRRVKYITLVNLLACGRDKQILDLALDDPGTPAPQAALFPEFLTADDATDPIAATLLSWFEDATRRDAVINQLRRLKTALGWEGAVARAADAVMGWVTGTRPGASLHRAA